MTANTATAGAAQWRAGRAKTATEPDAVTCNQKGEVMPKITLIVDDDDYRDIMREIAFRQRTRRPLPDGDSDTAGSMVGEIVRDLWEYRGLHTQAHQTLGKETNWPENTPGVNDGWGFSE